MERNYSTIEGTSKGYRVLVALLGVMVGVFIVSFLVAYLKGQQVWGVSNIIPWGQLITFYIYFIGLSAGPSSSPPSVTCSSGRSMSLLGEWPSSWGSCSWWGPCALS